MSDATRVQTSSASLSTLASDQAELEAMMKGGQDNAASGVGLTGTSNTRFSHDPSTGRSSSDGYTKATVSLNQHKGQVEVGGTWTTIEAALAAGLITKGADGSIQVAADESQSQQQQAQQQEQPASGEFMTETDQQAFGQAVQGLPEHVASGALSSAVASLAAGAEDLSGVQARMMQSGMSPDQAAAYIENAYSVLEPAWNRTLTSAGLADDPEERSEFYDWCRAGKGAQWSSAINEALHGNGTKEVRALASQWLRISAPNQADIATQGLKSVYRNGELYVIGEDGQYVPARNFRIKR